MKRKLLLTEKLLNKIKGNKFYGLYGEPGAGKTYTFKNVIIRWAEKNIKRVLYLSNRNGLKKQTYNEVKDQLDTLQRSFKGGLITIMNYQALERLIEKNDLDYLLDFDLIVLDEAHYLVTDSWNKSTHLTIKYIEQMDVPKILMTGTPEPLEYYNKLWNVENLRTPDRHNTNITEIRFFRSKEILLNEIQINVSDNNKVLAFVRGKTEYVKKMAIENSASFVCGHDNNFYEYADKNLISAVENNHEMLPAKFIISTSVWNEGINITDPNFKWVCSFNPTTMDQILQQLARLRNGNVTACVLIPSQPVLQTELNKNNDELNNPDITEPRRQYLLWSNKEIMKILNEGYINYILTFFPDVPYVDVDNEKKKKGLAYFLNNLVGIRMFKREQLKPDSTTFYNKDNCKTWFQEDFISEMVNIFGIRGNGNSKKRVGMNVIQAWIEEKNLGCKLVNKKDGARKSETYGKRYWIIEKVEELIKEDKVDEPNEKVRSFEEKVEDSKVYCYVRKKREDGTYEVIKTQTVDHLTISSEGKSVLKKINLNDLYPRSTLGFRKDLPSGWGWKVEELAENFSGLVLVKHKNETKRIVGVYEGEITNQDVLEGTRYKTSNEMLWILAQHKAEYDVKILEVVV